MTLTSAEKTRRYREKYPERAKQSKKNWEKENPNYHKNHAKKWREKNRKKIAEYKEKNKNRDSELGKIRCFAYRHLRQKIIEEKKQCEDCGSTENLQLHHKKYENKEEHLALLCKKCHAKIHSNGKKISNPLTTDD